MPALADVLQENCSDALFVAAWWSFAISFSLYNKEVFGEKKMDFPFPLLLTSTNFFFQWLAGALYIRCCAYIGPSQSHRNREPVTWRLYLLKVVPCAIGFALDISLSNLSLVHITVSFYTMVKATAPMFALLFGLIMGTEKADIRVFGSVLLICLGMSMATKGKTSFTLTGFFLIFSATVLSGFRWVLLQTLLQGEASLPTPMHVLRCLAPPAGLCVLCLGIIVEEPWNGGLNEFLQKTNSGPGEVVMLVCIGGILAIGLSVSSFWLLQRTSVLLFMGIGALKEVLTVFFSVLTYGDELTVNSVLGMMCVLVGVVAYKYHRYLTNRNEDLDEINVGTSLTEEDTLTEMIEKASLLSTKDSAAGVISNKNNDSFQLVTLGESDGKAAPARIIRENHFAATPSMKNREHGTAVLASDSESFSRTSV